MTTFLHRIAPDLGIGMVAGAVAGYGLHRLLPAPNGNFLVTMCVVNVCAGVAIRQFVSESVYSYANKHGYVNLDNKITNPLYGRLGLLVQFTSTIILPIFYRYVGHRLGYQVPSYLETMGYLTLAATAFWLTKTTYEILNDTNFPKPATK